VPPGDGNETCALPGSVSSTHHTHPGVALHEEQFVREPHDEHSSPTGGALHPPAANKLHVEAPVHERCSSRGSFAQYRTFRVSFTTPNILPPPSAASLPQYIPPPDVPAELPLMTTDAASPRITVASSETAMPPPRVLAVLERMTALPSTTPI
jgi:hypothetical protein